MKMLFKYNLFKKLFIITI